MSGIVGLYNLDGCPVEQTDIQRMLDSIAHRGPDGSDIWTDCSVGLGHRMLWTTPESLHEKLPLTNKAGNLTITADARIDNRDELIPTLNFNGRPRETIPDSEIILAAYEKWGEKCPTHLLGDFSFAIHDKRKQIIYCARDPIGIKPFYYYFKGGKFRWSSEPKAIFEDKTISKEPNLPLICLYLLNRFDEREETLYKDVYRLPPSHFMVLQNGQIRKGQYWDIDPDYSIRYRTDEEYAERFLELFKEAIRVRLRSHGPVGALLSGGLDSSSIVCTAQSLYQEKSIPDQEFEAFSIIFDEFSCDERSYINEIIRQWPIKGNFFTYEKNLSWIEFDQANYYPEVAYFPTLLIIGPALGNAQQKGIRVMMDGIGGDDLLGMYYTHLTDLFFRGEFFKLIKYLLSVTFDSSSQSPFSLFIQYCLKPSIPPPIKIHLRQFLRHFRGNGIPPWFNHSFLNNLGIQERLYKKQKRSPLQFPERSKQEVYDWLRFGWNFNIALEMIERFKTHFDIESRYPFLDRHMIEFCFSIPAEQLWSTEWTKAVLRKSMEGILPESIRCRRTKAEFSAMIDHHFNQKRGNQLEGLIQSSSLANLGIIQRDRLKKLFENYHDGNTNNSIRNTFQHFLWLEMWLQFTISPYYTKGDDKNGRAC